MSDLSDVHRGHQTHTEKICMLHKKIPVVKPLYRKSILDVRTLTSNISDVRGLFKHNSEKCHNHGFALISHNEGQFSFLNIGV